jgi:serine/threonine protein kinase
MAQTPPAAATDVETVLNRFDQAWRAGTPPTINEFLPSASAMTSAARRELLEELVKIDLEYRWRSQSRAGKPWLLEQYVQKHPELGPLNQLSVELISGEYWVRQHWGDRPTHQEYVTRFPQQTSQLRDLLRQMDTRLATEFAAQSPDELQRSPPAAGARPAAPPGRAPTSSTDLLNALRQLQLLSATQITALSREFPNSTDARTLSKELLNRGWLSPYQVNHLLQGHGQVLVLGPYLLLERLGEGGAGQVFKARHQKMGRIVALKVIRKELLADPEVVSRFYREIQVVSQLDHPNVVHAYDAGPAGATHFLAMEFVEGTDLGRLVKQGGPLPVLQACEYVRQAACGLQHAHERGLVHRDIKPHNLIVSRQDALVKVADLGLARLPRSANEDLTAGFAGVNTTGTLTPENAVMIGTADYLAPEQALDFHAADIRADIYSLGCTLFFLLTGQSPVAGGTLAQKVAKHLNAPPPPIDKFRKDVPSAVQQILRRMLAKRPEDRYQTPADVVQALTSVIGVNSSADQLTKAGFNRRRRIAMVSVAALLLLAIGLSWFFLPMTRNAPLRDLSNNTWRKIGAYGGPKGGHNAPRNEPWCYDADKKRFVTIGVSRDWPSNEIWSFDLGTEEWKQLLPRGIDPVSKNGLDNRPGSASPRAIGYDRDHKSVWSFSNSNSGLTGERQGLWTGSGDLGNRNWKHINAVPAIVLPTGVAYDETAKVIVTVGQNTGAAQTAVYDPQSGKVWFADPHASGNLTARAMVRYGAGFFYVPELKGCLLFTVTWDPDPKKVPARATLLFSTHTLAWQELPIPDPSPPADWGVGFSYDRKNNVVVLFGRGTSPAAGDLWVYDPSKNTWKVIKSENRPGGDDCRVMGYDEEHNVHLLVYGVEDNATVWAYRYKK